MKTPPLQQIKNKFIIKLFLIAFVFLLMVGLGDIRRQYLINLTIKGQPILMTRPSTVSGDFPASVNVAPYFFLNPKWVSSLAYMLGFLCLTLLLIYFYFFKKIYVLIALFFYLGIMLLSFLVIIIGNLLGVSKQAYAAMENFKELLSSPFVAMILFSAFLLNEKMVKN